MGWQTHTRLIQEQMDALNSYITLRAIPKGLARRLRRYFRHFYSQKSAIDEEKILGDLSAALRVEVVMHTAESLFGKVRSSCLP